MALLDADTFLTGGRGSPNAISPSSNSTNWTKLAGSNPTLSFSGTYGQFTNISAATVYQLGSGTAADANALVRFQYSSTADSMGLFLRQTATNTYYYLKTTATTIQIRLNNAGTDSLIASQAVTIAANTLYWLRFSVLGTNLYASFWASSGSEPTSWTLTGTDSTLAAAGGWGVRVAPSGTTDTVQIDSYSVNTAYALEDFGRAKFYTNLKLKSKTVQTFSTAYPAYEFDIRAQFSNVPLLATSSQASYITASRIRTKASIKFKTQFHALDTRSVGKFLNNAPFGTNYTSDYPYGLTFGLNIGAPPFNTAQYLSPTQIALTKAAGVGWYRIQMSAWQIWYNHGDPVSSWHWEALDDAIYKLKQAGFFVSFPLRFVNPTDGSGTLINGNYFAHYNTVHAYTGAEDWYMVNPTDAATFAQAVATRYNGVADVISTPFGGVVTNYGKLKLDAIEVGNEEFNQKFAKPTNPATIFGTYNDPIAYYNAYPPVGVNSKTNKAQPARSPHWLVPVLQACYPVIKAASPACTVVAAAIWDVKVANAANFVAGLYTDVNGTAKGFFDVVNAHYYSNKNTPDVTVPTCVSIDQQLFEIDTAMAAIPDNSPLWITEFGWQADQITSSSTTVSGAGSHTITVANALGNGYSTNMIVDSGANQETAVITNVSGTSITATFAKAHSGTYSVTFPQDCTADKQASNYDYLMNACMNKSRCTKIFAFTINDSHTGYPTSSLVQWGYNGGTGYQYLPAYTHWTNFVAAHRYWGTKALVPSNLGGTVSFSGVDGFDSFVQYIG